MSNADQKHISYSELKTWNDCPYKRKLIYGDKIQLFNGSIYTIFGTAIHAACEKGFTEGLDANQRKELFLKTFDEELVKIKLDEQSLKVGTVDEFKQQGLSLAEEATEEAKKHFDGWEVFAAEELLYQPTVKENYNFKGYVDLILKKGDKYALIDWKTCSWGWDTQKKSDKMTVYQLSLYKEFFSKKYNVDLKNIETFFILLKRTAKKNKVEVVPVTNGQKRIDNSVKLLTDAITNIQNGLVIKNRLSCEYCEFKKTEYCK
jgi:predicted RecB family nuclease